MTLRERYLVLGEFFVDFYFRARLILRGQIKKDSSVIFLMNHSGMNFPWDCFILFVCLRRAFGKKFSVTPLSAPVLFRHRILHPFGALQFWRLFCEEATLINFERLAARGENVLVNPEGIGGLAKGFNHRYQLQKFSSSFVRVALKYKKPVVPIYAINGEYLNPFAYKNERVNALAKQFGIPFLSFGLFTPLYALFPFALYISLPARLRYVLGQEIDVRGLLPEPLRATAYEDLNDSAIREVCERVRAHMQLELECCVRELGTVKYDWAGFFKSMWQAGSESWKMIPFTWPLLFYRTEHEPGSKIHLHSLFIKAAQLIPLLGWPIYLFLLWLPEADVSAVAGHPKASEQLVLENRSAMKKAL